MAQQHQTAQHQNWQTQPAGAAGVNPGPEPVFFFDGDFRTWAQVQQRAQLNRAIATQLAA